MACCPRRLGAKGNNWQRNLIRENEKYGPAIASVDAEGNYKAALAQSRYYR